MNGFERRRFLQKTLAAAAALSLSSITPSHAAITLETIRGRSPMRKGPVKQALVTWYSQTGMTERIGRLVAKRLEKSGATVFFDDMRSVDGARMKGMDLIVVGSPVFYYDTPDYVKRFIQTLPDLTGTPVAAYVTFGGPEGNQHNAACNILAALSDKGAVPVGLRSFMNMSTFPLAWSEKKVHHKTWMNRNLPDAHTYEEARRYAAHLVNQVASGTAFVAKRNLTLREMATWVHPIWWTKKLVSNHGIDQKVCIGCGLCEEKCPAGAIDIGAFTIDRHVCELCFGCINNCPVQAVTMNYNGERVFGYPEFMKRKKLSIIEPEEVQKTPA